MKRLTSIALLFVFIVVGIGLFGCQKNPTIRFYVYCMNGKEKQALFVKKTDSLNLKTPQSKYYNFDGWYADIDYETKLTDSVGFATSAFAKWTKKDADFSGAEKGACDIQSLIFLAEKLGFHGTNAQIAATQFMRQNRYNTLEWDTFGGKLSQTIQQAFEAELQDSLYLANLQTIDYGNIGVDFPHFCASLNVILRSGVSSANSLICGYVGDLAQVAISIQSEIPQEQYLEAKSIIGAGSGVFSSSDFWADVLAATIGNSAINNNTSFAEILTDQLQKSEQEIATEFANIYFKELSRDCIIQTLQSQFAKPVINAWLYRNGQALDGAIDQTIMAFADYLINIK